MLDDLANSNTVGVGAVYPLAVGKLQARTHGEMQLIKYIPFSPIFQGEVQAADGKCGGCKWAMYLQPSRRPLSSQVPEFEEGS